MYQLKLPTKIYQIDRGIMLHETIETNNNQIISLLCARYIEKERYGHNGVCRVPGRRRGAGERGAGTGQVAVTSLIRKESKQLYMSLA